MDISDDLIELIVAQFKAWHAEFYPAVKHDGLDFLSVPVS
jgi:hypothetical protein